MAARLASYWWVPRFALLVALVLVPCAPAGAQQLGTALLFPNGEAELYLRTLQTAGHLPLRSWSIRPFGPDELLRMSVVMDSVAGGSRVPLTDSLRTDTLVADSLLETIDSARVPLGWAAREALNAPYLPNHPWAARLKALTGTPGRRGGWVPVESRTVFNSGFPFGANDGVMWAGRGLTQSVTGGAYLRLGPISLDVAPIFFSSQNVDFDLPSNGLTGPQRYGTTNRPTQVDLPRRFGDGVYTRLDPGQSAFRLDAGPVTAGVSTAAQAWGPAATTPMIVGQNAGGFPHSFFGTSRPLELWIARVHTRLILGRLEQSEYSDVSDGETRRLASGSVLVIKPRFPTGLEVGFTSFVHTVWPTGGPGASEFLEPVRGLFFSGREQGVREGDALGAGNQLASVFARWVFPRGGVEVYGEFLRDDRAYDLRNAVVEPDHDAAYVLGARKVWLRDRASWWVLRGELASTQISHLDLTDRRAAIYTHNVVRQGHTHRGQLLGGGDSFGGTASEAALDRYHTHGRWTASYQRTLRGDPGDFGLSGSPDVVNSLGLEALRFLGSYHLTAGVRGVWELNRDFAGDAFNLNLVLGVRTAVR